MSELRPVPGCAGGRIRVVLGETGSDYLYYLDEDDGDREWQSSDWTVKQGGPPAGLCRQMNNMIAKGRHITSVDFDRTGQWFVAGKKRDGSGDHSWWGGTDAGEAIEKSLHRGKVYFGGRNSWGTKISVVLKGSNGYATKGIGDTALLKKIKQMHSEKKSIEFIRCFNAVSYTHLRAHET